MHTYQQRWIDDPPSELPQYEDFRFHDALDVVRWAELDPVLTWRSYPDIWHLDDDGEFRCASRGSSLDSVRTFAANPGKLVECRLVAADGPCPDRWLVIEPRHPWRKEREEVDERDAQAFGVLRQGLACHGITLVDVMIFDQQFHWWSMHELTSGTTRWS